MLEFLARVLDHPQDDWGHSVPDPSQQLLRYWGWYSNAARGRRERHQGEASATPRASMDPADGESRQRRLTWSQLIRKVYEIDPLLCPYCGAVMCIHAFILDLASLRRILGHLGFAPQQPEPLAHSPPDEMDLYVENA
ncbi:MAG: hypothetical protein ABI689_08865 [Thermoanaerobaculia bacterium]